MKKILYFLLIGIFVFVPLIYAAMDTGGTSTGAPTTADYLVGTSNASLSAEIVVGTTPGGQLSGTWASPTIDDLFLKNDANDTTSGTLTAAGFTTVAGGDMSAGAYNISTIVTTVDTYTDDAIQAAINALPITGGIIKLLPGTYVCDASITLPSRIDLNITIQGNGKSTILSHTATDASDCIVVSGPGAAAGSRAQNLTLSDFHIIGNSSAGDGIFLNNVHYALIKNVRLELCGAYGLKATTVGSTTYDNVIAEECDDGGFYLHGVHQNQLINCEATQNNGAGVTIGLAYETLIVGNVLEYNDVAQLYLLDGGDTAQTPGYISSNQMSSGTADGIKIDNAYRWGISNNAIGGNAGDGIEITDSHQLTIIGNSIQDNKNSIVLVNSSENIITNNHIMRHTTSDLIQQDSDCYKNIILNNGTFNDNIICMGDAKIIDNCETAWTGKANVTTTRDSSSDEHMEGSYGSKNVIATAFSTDLIATHDFSSLDLSEWDKVGFWIMATEAVSADVLQIVLDDTSACDSPLETLNIPALTADNWKYVELSFSDSSALTAIISVGLNAASDPGAITVYIDNITTEYPIYWLDASENIMYMSGTVYVKDTMSVGALVNLPYLTGLPSDAINGSIWAESDGIHVYYNGSERKLTDEAP